MKKILAAILFCCFCLGVMGFSACKRSGQQEKPISSSGEESNISDSSSGEHEYGEWIEEVPATETKEGIKGHYHCDRCGKDFDSEYTVLDSLVIPKITHIVIPEVGEIMTFGNYHGATEWIVLAKDEDRTLIITKDIIDAKPYNEQLVDITWENCTLRSWLNNEYINEAFSAEEKNSILTTYVVNNDAPDWGIEGGNDTKDKVFLLSIGEANKYFKNDAVRMAQGTYYAKGNDLWVDTYTYIGYSIWWLRSPGGNSDYASGVYSYGGLYYDGDRVDLGICGVRPALWVDFVHSWDEGKITKEPTCTEKGLRTYTCTVCGKTRTEAIPALGHNYGEWIEEVPATETKDGVKGHYHCDRCGKDLDAKYNTLESLVIPKGTNPIPEVGEIMTFGNYHGATEWIVLDKDEDKTLIITKDIIDAKPYNEQLIDITWENCTLRSWLNNEYINTAFSAEEKNRMLMTQVVNNDNTYCGPPTPGGNDTEDKVFLLSLEEANTYFADDEVRMAKGTDYAKENDLWVDTVYHSGYSFWWLRSPGGLSNYAARVGNDGSINYGGNYVDDSYCGVRPALWVDFVHNWDEGSITQEPTCTENGTRTYTCTVCGKIRNEMIPPLGHKWDEGEVTKAATCTENGTTKYTCTVCGATKEEIIQAPGHNYANWIPEVPATETKPGTKGHYHCDRCGQDFNALYNVLEDLAIPAGSQTAIPEVGGVITFGNYNGATEWIVLAKDEEKALIITKDIIDAKPYNTGMVETWKDCTLRSWLNNEYINTAFSAEERNWILTTHLVNNDNPEFGTEGGNDTEDKVFLLSLEEAETYFANEAARMAKGTEYAKGNGLWVCSSDFTNDSQYWGYSFWWLRSPGYVSGGPSFVNKFDSFNDYGLSVDDSNCGVRPALWVDFVHSWDEGVITKEPMCTEKGIIKYTCTVCGKTRTEEVPALGHDYGEWIEKIPATETEPGTKGHYHCNRCGKDLDAEYNTLESLVIPAGSQAVIPEVGETITFGNYHGATEWTVLVTDEEKTLIIAKDIIDAKSYNEQWDGITWEDCTLRSWLNNEYINATFSEEERNRILTTHVVNNDNPEYGTEGGNDTEDKVFILSLEEAKTYFADNAARMAKGTDYAKGNGLWVCSSDSDPDYSQYWGYSYWWLRSPGGASGDASSVLSDGSVTDHGTDYDGVGWAGCGVRPALWIRNQ